LKTNGRILLQRLSRLLAPPLDATDRLARYAELVRKSKALVDPPIDAACKKRVTETSVAVVGGGPGLGGGAMVGAGRRQCHALRGR
jgi:hypothetical protein